MSRESDFTVAKKIESGPAEVIDTGTVISFAGNPITLSYKELDIAIVFDFQRSERTENAYVDGNFTDSSPGKPGVLKLTLYNFDDRFGAGTIKPLRIGQYEGRKLYIQLRVYTLIGSPDKTLNYTIYKGEEVSESDRA
jgi:hypothetical protein